MEGAHFVEGLIPCSAYSCGGSSICGGITIEGYFMEGAQSCGGVITEGSTT